MFSIIDWDIQCQWERMSYENYMNCSKERFWIISDWERFGLIFWIVDMLFCDRICWICWSIAKRSSRWRVLAWRFSSKFASSAMISMFISFIQIKRLSNMIIKIAGSVTFDAEDIETKSFAMIISRLERIYLFDNSAATATPLTKAEYFLEDICCYINLIEWKKRERKRNLMNMIRMR